MNQVQKMQVIGREAVVIGASIGGILAARALADAFERVTIIERDAFPTPGEQRKGVPQGRHAHGLLFSGFQIMESFFPGMKEELLAQGAMEGTATGQIRWNMGSGNHVQFDSDLHGMNVSRPLLESHLRSRLLALPNVRAISACDVLGLVTNADNSRVCGVRILRRRDGSAEEVLEAALIVDASGRGSRTPQWLEAMGYERPREEQVKINIAYTTRTYRRDPRQMDGDRGAIISPTPANKHVGVILAQEGDRWIVTLAGYMGDTAPTDNEGFINYARSLNGPEIYDIIRGSEPISEPVQFKYPASQWRHYEQLTRFPAGYLVFGDAICSFNPIYGQGMSVAAQEAAALHDCLPGGLDTLAQRFFARAAKVIEIPWSIAVGEDLKFPEVEGPRTKQTAFINWYMAKVHKVACFDKTVSLAFHKVANLLAPPPSLMHPRIALRVLLGSLFPPRGARAAEHQRTQTV